MVEEMRYTLFSHFPDGVFCNYWVLYEAHQATKCYTRYITLSSLRLTYEEDADNI